MTHRVLIVAVGLIGAVTTSVSGQTPNLSGTWTLDLSRSRIATPLLHGGGDGGPADTLHITHAANGTLTVGNEVNAAQAWSYVIDGDSSIPLGEGDRLTVTSRWEGARLVSEGDQQTGAPGSILGVKEIRSLSPDGQTLTVEVTTRTSGGEHTNTLVYRKIT